MLQLNLKRIFKARGVQQPYKFLTDGGFVSFTAHKYKNAQVRQIRLDHIERLCILLNCTPNDIFEWFPDDLLENRNDHPLNCIRQREKTVDINKKLARLPLQKLEEIEQYISQLA
ncbi:MAG: helix-turn-helix transcriptional regulator [Chitinophagales bacterium]